MNLSLISQSLLDQLAIILQSPNYQMRSNQVDEPQPTIKKEHSQFKALFLKNAQLQSKQPCTNVCQIMTPVICLIFTYLIKTIATDQLPNGSVYSDTTYPYVFNDFSLADATSRKVNKTTNQPIPDTPSRNNFLQWYLYECVDNCKTNSYHLGSYDGSFQKNNSDGETIFGSIINDRSSQNLVKNVSLNYYNDSTQLSDRYVPFFIPSQDLNAQLFNRAQTSENNDFKAIKSGRDGLDTIPDGGISFHQISLNKLNVTLRINDIRDLDMHRNNGVTNFIQSRQIKGQSTWQEGIKDIITPYGMLRLQDLVTHAYANFVNQNKTSIPMNYQSGYIFTRDTASTKSFVDNIINTISALIFPIALSLLFPVMLYGLVLEKEERLVQMMKMNGMKISNYWLVYFIFNFILCSITNIVFFMLGAFVLKTEFFLSTSPALLFLVAVGWSFSQIGLAAFFQTFLSKSRSANIIGYVIAIWTMMISSTLSVGVYQTPAHFPGWLQALPPCAFNRLFYLMLSNCSDADCYNTMSEIDSQMKNCIVALYVGGLVLLILGAYLLEVLPQQFGVSRSIFFPFIQFYAFLTCKDKISFSRPQKDKQLKRYLSDNQQDPLSKAQRQKISKMNDIDDSPLIINNLRKLYKKQGYVGDYAAVKSLNLKVQDKQTFGLLGPNGAGKTTLISMLTGMITPNYGNAWIGGYDINGNIAKAQLQMGVCPQFDLVWPQLTVEEHLRFYARLKGIPGAQLQKKISQAIQEVNLTKFKQFLASQLSGGMKRRLSIAISLVGDPKIVFLDEPTTGLDPDNRRQIWEVLAKCQEKRALFLTTHMMQEAEALCHRIGIITHGTLRTLGSQLKLKKTYGEGYRLSLTLLTKQKKLVSPQLLNVFRQNDLQKFNNQDEEENLRRSINEMVEKDHSQGKNDLERGIKAVEQYITEHFPGAVKKRLLGSSLLFRIPATFKISAIFSEIHSMQRELNITNIAVTESSLEDVFITVVLAYDKIVDDEETGQMKLVQVINQPSELDLRQEVKIPKDVPSPIKRNSNLKFGSVIQKDRESVFSNEQAQKKDPQQK